MELHTKISRVFGIPLTKNEIYFPSPCVGGTRSCVEQSRVAEEMLAGWSLNGDAVSMIFVRSLELGVSLQKTSPYSEASVL